MNKRHINVKGTVTAITYPAWDSAPVVRVTVQVGATMLALVFQSRRSVEALDIGQLLHIRGAVNTRDGIPTIFNPEYRILGETVE